MSKKLDFLHSDYLILAFGLSFGGGAYLVLSHQPSLQIGIVFLTGVFYILWGAIHHAREKDWHYKILLEYILIAALAMTLWLTFTIRS